MIDHEWMLRSVLLAGITMEEGETRNLAAELGEECEVLPHLLLKRGGFADWPATRAALEQSSKAVIRPRALAQAADSAANHQAREAVRQLILRTIAPSEGNDPWTGDEIIRLRARITSQPRPNDFIATD